MQQAQNNDIGLIKSWRPIKSYWPIFFSHLFISLFYSLFLLSSVTFSFSQCALYISKNKKTKKNIDSFKKDDLFQEYIYNIWIVPHNK